MVNEKSLDFVHIGKIGHPTEKQAPVKNIQQLSYAVDAMVSLWV
jgi:hypothetical protein